jgi:RNA-binding protein
MTDDVERDENTPDENGSSDEDAGSSLSDQASMVAASPGMNGRQRRHLRALGHALKPIVHLGHNGLTDALARQLDRALEDHELIKVRVLETAPCSRGEAALWIHATVGASVAQIVGRNLLVYRPDAEEPRIRLPR